MPWSRPCNRKPCLKGQKATKEWFSHTSIFAAMANRFANDFERLWKPMSARWSQPNRCVVCWCARDCPTLKCVISLSSSRFAPDSFGLASMAIPMAGNWVLASSWGNPNNCTAKKSKSTSSKRSIKQLALYHVISLTAIGFMFTTSFQHLCFACSFGCQGQLINLGCSTTTSPARTKGSSWLPLKTWSEPRRNGQSCLGDSDSR